MDFGNWDRSIHEMARSSKYTVSEKRDDKGRFVVAGDIGAFLKDLHCIELSEAMKKLNELKDRE